MPRLPRLAPAAAAGALGITLAAGLLVPVYTDEVAWRLQTARAPFDGGVDRGLADQCGPNTTAVAPWFLQPMRHLSAWAQAALADPRSVRLTGVVLAFVTVALLVALARAAGAGGRAGTALAAGLLGLGTLPWLLVWSRPEQAILLALLAALLLALAEARAPARLGAMVLLAVAALGYHPKAVAFALVIAVAAAATRGPRAARAAAAGAIVAFALAAGQYWQARLACPGDALIRARAAAETVFAGPHDPALLGALAANLSPLGYVAGTAAAAHAMSDWLPPVRLPDLPGLLWYAAVALAWAAAFAALATGVVLGLRIPARRRAALLGATIGLCLLGWGATQPNKNAYEAALVLPLAVAALLLVWPALAARWPRGSARAAFALVPLAIASQALLLATYARPLARAAAMPGTLPDQPFSFTAWGYPALRRDILAAGRACGIAPAGARHLLVDDLTYWPFLRSWRPYHRVAVLGPWNGTIADPLGYLAAQRSSGAVLQCALLPPALRARARAVGGICCLEGSG